MADKMPVAWTEGMFLRPQHFQQAHRSVMAQISQLTQSQHAYPWGALDIEIDNSMLSVGQFMLTKLEAVMPDHCFVDMPQQHQFPEPLIVNKDIRDQTVYLAIPALKSNGINVSMASENNVTRYHIEDYSLCDDTLESDSHELIQVSMLNSRLMLESEDHAGYVCLAIARIVEVTSEGLIKLDRSFIPPVLKVGNFNQLTSQIREVGALLKQRADAIAGRLTQGFAGSSSVADFMMLQALNKYDAIFQSLLSNSVISPYQLYERLVELVGEIATFSIASKRVPQLPNYDHDNLTSIFASVTGIVHQSLSQVLEQTAIEIKLEQSQFGISFGQIGDKSLLQSAQFVLAVKASVPHEELRQILPSQIKIGTVETIRDLVNNQVSGITISSLPAAPRQVPYVAGCHYFELNTQSEFWQQLTNSGGIALHLSGNYPDLSLSLWAIRS